MADFKRVKDTEGHDFFVNVELVRVVRRAGPTTARVSFDVQDDYLVQGNADDVIDALWPPRRQHLKA